MVYSYLGHWLYQREGVMNSVERAVQNTKKLLKKAKKKKKL